MSDKPAIYDQFDKAFARVSAYVVLDKRGECVAKIAFKFPADGAGRLYAYVHIIGVEMVRGHASGYGYDKRSAAVSSAIPRIAEYQPHATESMSEYGRKVNEVRRKFIGAASAMDGEYWDTRLRNAGFNVIQAV